MSILDSGAEITVMSETVYDDLASEGFRTLYFPVNEGALISVQRAKNYHIKKDSLIEFEITDARFDQVVIIAGQFRVGMMVGANSLCDCEVTVNFRDK